ncbi:hypothetical protein GOP47_0024278 [Adiantum capillus-veneris]|uniref:Uncharacterized protein n=1 Tax=Adiantum capillus-veneris TaxID=13818 RepID=A0A9D4U5T5_ADICA|nr:hypothetical protein GOP47_0024023 [Adiantum capillus-veneris]KAI5061773.1 hypothetical protein GOP47_0024278 [Adiantum capillus-veneris]
MDCSGRGRLSLYRLSSLGHQTFDIYERDPSVWTGKTNFKAKSSHLAAPSVQLHEVEATEHNVGGVAEKIAQSIMVEENGYEEGWKVNVTTRSKLSDSAKVSQVLLATSPQSTLAGVSSSWDHVSPSAGSTGDISSGVSSPPTPVSASHVRTAEKDALDLLYAELLRLKMEDEIKVREQHLMHLKQQQLLWKIRQRQTHDVSSQSLGLSKPTHMNAPYRTPMYSSNDNGSGPAFGYYRSKLTRSCDQEFNQGRHKHTNGPASSSRSRATVAGQCTSSHVQGQGPGAALSLNGRHHNSKVVSAGLRAVFLGAPGARESGGTGVFLPRRVGSAHDSKRKPACSTVLLPSRIVQALNLNVEDTLACSLNPSTPVSMRRVFSRHANHTSSSAPDRMSPAEVQVEQYAGVESKWVSAFASTLQEVAPDVCLPTEWTY